MVDRLRAAIIGKKIKNIQVHSQEKTNTLMLIFKDGSHLFISASPDVELDMKLNFKYTARIDVDVDINKD